MRRSGFGARRPLALRSGYLSPEEFQWRCGPAHASDPQRDRCARTRLGHTHDLLFLKSSSSIRFPEQEVDWARFKSK